MMNQRVNSYSGPAIAAGGPRPARNANEQGLANPNGPGVEVGVRQQRPSLLTIPKAIEWAKERNWRPGEHLPRGSKYGGFAGGSVQAAEAVDLPMHELVGCLRLEADSGDNPSVGALAIGLNHFKAPLQEMTH